MVGPLGAHYAAARERGPTNRRTDGPTDASDERDNNGADSIAGRTEDDGSARGYPRFLIGVIGWPGNGARVLAAVSGEHRIARCVALAASQTTASRTTVIAEFPHVRGRADR
jgi:hypothetical protein